MEHLVLHLPRGDMAAMKLLDELAEDRWRVIAATELRVILCRAIEDEEGKE